MRKRPQPPCAFASVPAALLCYRFSTASPSRAVCTPAPRATQFDGKTGTVGVSKGMSQQPESPLSSLALSPASLPGPAGEFASAPPPQLAPNPEPAPAFTATEQPDPPAPQRIPRWLVRVELFLRVMLRIYIGLAICYAPWSHTFWDQNPIFLQFPALSVIAANGAVRGLVSGLGLLNLWIAFHDAIQRRDG